MKKIVVIFSGGLDSTTLLYKALTESKYVHAISYIYGQKHSKEIDFAKQTCKKLKVPHKIIDMSFFKDIVSTSSLVGEQEIPEGHYASENMKSTVVPNRNMVFLALATAYAINIGFDTIAYGPHAGDHDIYPDCRIEFIEAMRKVLCLADYNEIELYTPFISLRKEDIISIGNKLGVDYSDTWSCYKGGNLHCGKCGTCVERIEAFNLAKVQDPTTYASKK